MQYKLSKGFQKGLLTVFVMGLSVVVMTGFSDLNIWDLATTYIKPLLGTITVGGALTMIINYLKIKVQE